VFALVEFEKVSRDLKIQSVLLSLKEAIEVSICFLAVDALISFLSSWFSLQEQEG
jgi:hypothetical protein